MADLSKDVRRYQLNASIARSACVRAVRVLDLIAETPASNCFRRLRADNVGQLVSVRQVRAR